MSEELRWRDQPVVNVGYMTGYYSPETAEKMQEWFGVVHPIFGPVGATTSEEQLDLGRRMASS